VAVFGVGNSLTQPETIMSFDIATYDFARRGFSFGEIKSWVPAAFADRAASGTGPAYSFISTAELVRALLDAGFVISTARQSGVRRKDPRFARHIVRMRQIRESITLVDAIPEIVLVNSHDGTSSYVMHAGLFRPVCSNGLLMRIADMGFIRLAHRNIRVEEVVKGALELAGRFANMRVICEAMAARVLDLDERRSFATRALALRYEGTAPIESERLLGVRREADHGEDLWRVYQRVQENLTRGGLAGRSQSGRQVRTRAIGAIREDVRINLALWNLAVDYIQP
jgi:hypothetical protein